MENKKLGSAGELFVKNELEKSGYNVLDMNFHSAYGEIDIIAVKLDTITFVEVKTRTKNSKSAVESITLGKQQKIIKTAVLYMQEKNLDLQPRFDVAIVDGENDEFKIDYYKNAFEAY